MGSSFSSHEYSLHWATGLLDGEGSFGYQYKQGKHGNFRVSMGSRDEDVIDRVVYLFGGNKYTTTLRDKLYYTWTINGDLGRQLAIDVYPLMCKRRQSQIATALWSWWNAPVGNKDKTQCINGHKFTIENTIVNPSAPNRRRCRVCTIDQRRRADNKRRSKV